MPKLDPKCLAQVDQTLLRARIDNGDFGEAQREQECPNKVCAEHYGPQA